MLHLLLSSHLSFLEFARLLSKHSHSDVVVASESLGRWNVDRRVTSRHGLFSEAEKLIMSVLSSSALAFKILLNVVDSSHGFLGVVNEDVVCATHVVR